MEMGEVIICWVTSPCQKVCYVCLTYSHLNSTNIGGEYPYPILQRRELREGQVK